MKLASTIVLLTSVTLFGQQSGGLAERFKQLDRNGDGKVTREEAGQMPMFDQWDANKDGAVTLEEITGFLCETSRQRHRNHAPPARPCRTVYTPHGGRISCRTRRSSARSTAPTLTRSSARRRARSCFRM